MRSKDTEKMDRIVEFINDCYFKEQRTPTVQEIADYIGMYKGNIGRYLKEMCDRGMITMGTGWKTIKTRLMMKDHTSVYKAPILGHVACGEPMFAEENIEGFIALSKDMLGPGEFFGLWAKGESMINADIYPGDLVIIRSQDYAEDGDIVVALCNNEDATLKRFFRDTKRKGYRLHPENDEMEDMFFKKITIQGVAVKVLKDVH